LSLVERRPELINVNAGIVRDAGYLKSLREDEGRSMKFEKSLALHERALKRIPLGAQTLSKTVSQYVKGITPIFVTHGKGPYLYDVDGNEWIDYIAALGPVVLGYADQEVNDAITAQLKSGMSFSLSHPMEIDLAERIASLVPGVDRVRFGKNGSDVTSAAIRAARAHTGRDHIAICGYHGWQDWYIGTTSKGKGVPEAVRQLSHKFNFNDLQSLTKLFSEYPGKIAAVILESVSVHPPEGDFLQKVKELTHANGAVLIFDEVINGFRLRPGGGGHYYGVTPDLITMGKAMGNGAPIAAIGGNAEIMREFDEIFFSFTFGGDTIGIAAALKTIEILERDDGYSRLFQLGERLMNGFNQLVAAKGLKAEISCGGLPHHSFVLFTGDEEEGLVRKSYFQQECAKRGLLFLGPHFTTLSHTEAIIDRTLTIYDEVLDLYKDAIKTRSMKDRLLGPMIRPVFRARV
jgi:glutamate-1-semialdehyde 2,1-aminomutase/spore coat polysaccharide biosynthesis protein SpsF